MAPTIPGPGLPGNGLSGIVSKAKDFGRFAWKGMVRKIITITLIVGGAYFIVLR